mmetsp:Transcript_28713/g.32190  ORF Transcript_28713/g.32190 Transcript_28713/m.32190 type:complete len:560 (+) Transcript_28713:146-1825(+)
MNSQPQASATSVSTSMAMNIPGADAGHNSNNNSSNDISLNTGSVIFPPAFLEDPSTFLTSISSQPSSSEGISLLAGPVSKWFLAAPSSMGHPAKHVAYLFLSAAASQLREGQDNVQPMAATTGNVGSSTLGSMASAILGARATTGTNAAITIARDTEKEKTRSKHRAEILAAVEAAAILCSSNGEAVTNSGILPVLAQIVTYSMSSSSLPTNTSSTNNAASIATSLSSLSASSSKSFPNLNLAHISFLQCAIAAKQYLYAEGIISGTWPRPTSALRDVSAVLRYYYLRGMIHFGCRDYASAHRCWWTCLSVPSDDGCSPIAVNAWKKLTLVQPLRNNNASTTASSRVHPATRLPKCMPKLPTRGSDSSKFRMAGFAESKEEEKDDISVYIKLGPAVVAGDRQTVEKLIRTHESTLTADGNFEMSLECIRRVKEIEVTIASKLFTVTSITILARRWNVSPEEVLQQLSDAVEIVPYRVEEDGTVVFLNEVLSCANNQSLGDLTEWMKLLERMQELDVNLSTSPKYNALIRKEGKSGGSSSGAMISEMIPAAAGPQGVEDF